MARRRNAVRNPVAALGVLDTVWSPDFDGYASGQLDLSQVRCVLCGHAPCDCPPFGTSEYLALVDRAHGRTRGDGA
jgi:hypothetical protein